MVKMVSQETLALQVVKESEVIPEDLDQMEIRELLETKESLEYKVFQETREILDLMEWLELMDHLDLQLVNLINNSWSFTSSKAEKINQSM